MKSLLLNKNVIKKIDFCSIYEIKNLTSLETNCDSDN